VSRLAALAAAAFLAASCGGPAPVPPAVEPSGPPAAVGTPAAPSASIPAGACRLSEPEAVAAPASLRSENGWVAGVTDRGEILVLQSHLAGVADTMSVLDPASGAVTPVVSRQPAASQDEARSQIDGRITGDADWVVWQEGGLDVVQGDWHIWAFDRRSGEVREVARFNPGTEPAMAQATDVSLLGDLAAWAAPVALGAGRFGMRVYVADLRARTVRRLEPEANYPSLVSSSAIVAAVKSAADPGTGYALAQPASIPLPAGAATPAYGIAPSIVQAAAASTAGAVVVRLLKDSTAADPGMTSDVVAGYPSGQTRVFGLHGQFSPVAAGPGFLAWSDHSHLWVQPSGQPEPTQVLDAGEDAVWFTATGPVLYWHTDRASDKTYDWSTGRLARVTCP